MPLFTPFTENIFDFLSNISLGPEAYKLLTTIDNPGVQTNGAVIELTITVYKNPLLASYLSYGF